MFFRAAGATPAAIVFRFVRCIQIHAAVAGLCSGFWSTDYRKRLKKARKYVVFWLFATEDSNLMQDLGLHTAQVDARSTGQICKIRARLPVEASVMPVVSQWPSIGTTCHRFEFSCSKVDCSGVLPGLVCVGVSRHESTC